MGSIEGPLPPTPARYEVQKKAVFLNYNIAHLNALIRHLSGNVLPFTLPSVLESQTISWACTWCVRLKYLKFWLDWNLGRTTTGELTRRLDSLIIIFSRLFTLRMLWGSSFLEFSVHVIYITYDSWVNCKTKNFGSSDARVQCFWRGVIQMTRSRYLLKFYAWPGAFLSSHSFTLNMLWAGSYNLHYNSWVNLQ